jgi:ADP-heptose:LPS heptosyltransferase
MKIAALRFSALGDIASTIPALRAFKHRPTIITSPMGYELLKDEFYDFMILKNKKLFEVTKLIFNIRKRNFNILFDFQCNDRSFLITKFAGIKTYNNHNIATSIPSDIFYKIAKPSNCINSLDRTFTKKEKTYVVLNCGSSPKWLSKRLPIEKWKEINKILYERYNLPFVLTGDKNEQEYIEHISKHLIGNIKVLAGKTTLQELKEVLTKAYLTVSTDSAAMHISAVQKTPTIGIFGPTNWKRAAPFGPWSTAIYDKTFYPDGIPPQKSQNTIRNYFDNIELEEGLDNISEFL